MLSREEILSKVDLIKEPVTIEEWGGEVLVSEMTGEDREYFDRSLYNENKDFTLEGSGFRLIVLTLVNADGQRIFTLEDIPKIKKLGSLSLATILKKSRELNGLAEKSIEIAQGNSDAAPSGDSTSD